MQRVKWPLYPGLPVLVLYTDVHVSVFQDIQLAKILVEGLEGLSTDQSAGGSGELGEATVQAKVPTHLQKGIYESMRCPV